MSQRSLSTSLDLFALCKLLQHAGWDAFASDLVGEVAARRESLPNRGVWNLIIDHSGQWRFTATHEVELAAGRELMRSGQTMRLLKEKQQVLTIAGRLASVDDLPTVLAELAHLAQEESDPPNHEAEGELAWHEDHELRAEMSDR